MKLGEEIMTIDEMIDWLYCNAYRLNSYREKIIEHPQYLMIIRWLEELKARRESEYDTCKYSIKNNLVFVGCANKSIASTFAYYNELDDYKYCPYCSKEIKIQKDKV